MSAPAFSLAVYCGSRAGERAAYAQAARDVGAWIGRHDGRLVYGGGHNGLMGTVADAALQAGAPVLGVIPHSMVEREWAHQGCSELRVVHTMHERKQLMASEADAFVALPGGIGTLEEFFEAWTWNQLGFHDKPVGLLNIEGYYDGLLTFMEHSVAQGFLSPWQMSLVRVDDRVERLLPQLVQAAGLSQASRLDLS